MYKRIFRFIGFGIGALALLVLILGMAWYKSDISVQDLEAKYLTPESSYINILDARMHVRQRGTGPAVFLIHGSFASLHTWSAWENELSKSFRTISMDLPGHGLTGPSPSRSYSTDDYEKLVMVLADNLGIDTFYVAGNSMGGNVAWKMALHHPERVRKVILIDAGGFGGLTTDPGKHKQQSTPFIFRMLRWQLLGNIFTKITPRFMVEMNMKEVYGNPSKIRPGDIDRFYELVLREGNRKATIDRIRRQGRDLQDSIKYIDVPTLIVWGEQDRWIPVEHANRFHNLIQNSQLMIFPQAGHIPMEEIPEETVEAAIAFLNR